MIEKLNHKINFNLISWMAFSLSFILVGLVALMLFLR